MLFSWVNSSRTLRIKIATFSSRILRIKNAKFLEYCFYVNTSIYRDFQICISVPLRHKKFNSGFGLILISVPVHKEMSVFIVYTIVLESYHYLQGMSWKFKQKTTYSFSNLWNHLLSLRMAQLKDELGQLTTNILNDHFKVHQMFLCKSMHVLTIHHIVVV